MPKNKCILLVFKWKISIHWGVGHLSASEQQTAKALRPEPSLWHVSVLLLPTPSFKQERSLASSLKSKTTTTTKLA